MLTAKNTIQPSDIYPVVQSTVTATCDISGSATVKKTVARCGGPNCKVKLLLTDYACKCANRFCSQHRQPETHACTYDFKAAGLKNLSSTLLKVEGAKFERL